MAPNSAPALPEDLHAQSSQLPNEILLQCEEIIGYHFQTPGLLIRCLTHASAARTRLESNERLEFLGDAILGAIACELLFELFPNSSEGELTRIKSVVVSRSTCARLVREMKLQPFLILGKGITGHTTIPSSILATVFEGIIGGIYLDGGYAVTRDIVRKMIYNDVMNVARSTVGVNYKSLFQQRTQRDFNETPIYTVLEEAGPDHSKYFCISAVVGDRVFPPAWGASKKISEQHAAQIAMCILDEEPVPEFKIPAHLAE